MKQIKEIADNDNAQSADGDENRLYILTLLKDGEKCACKLLDALQISQSTLSHHMKILCDADIVIGRKEGKWIHYSLSLQGADYAKELLDFYTGISPEPRETLFLQAVFFF